MDAIITTAATADNDRVLAAGLGTDGLARLDLTFTQGGGCTVTVQPALTAAALEEHYGILTRVGLHCAPAAHKTLGSYPAGSIRFSFGWFNTPQQIDAALAALQEVCHGPETT